MANKPHMNLIFIGHVDHGKSTLIGRLFFETGVLSPQELDKYKKLAQELGKGTWELAYAVDLTPEERKTGMTIQLAHKKFSTQKFDFTIIDAPGHKDFVKNMITGASQADAAVLVIAAKEGVMEQTREHGYLAKVMGIKQIIVAVNKMDTVNYEEERFNKVKDDVTKLLQSVGFREIKAVVPVSALEGVNVSKPGTDKMPWYKGPTLLDALNSLDVPEKPIDLPLRLPVEDVYSIKGIGTVPVGKVISGVLKVGQKVVFEPSNVQAEVKSIEMHHESIPQAEPGDNVGFNVRGVDKTQIRRGDVVGPVDKPPTVAKKFLAQILVLNHPTVLTVGYTPVFHVHTGQTACKFTKLVKKIDPRTGQVIEENPQFLKTGDAAIVEITPTKPMVIEKKSDIPQLASFAIRDMGQTVAAGVCIDILEKR